jgi:PAS domain S-box-containing protein
VAWVTIVPSMLEQLALHIPLAVVLVDTDFRVLFVNERWTADYHVPGDRAVGLLLSEVVPALGADLWRIAHDCRAGRVYTDSELPFVRSPGETEWLRREVRAWSTAEGEFGGLMIYTEVVTARKRARDDLQAQHRFLRQVIDLNTSFIFAKDISGQYTLINKALADAYGTTPEEAIGKYDEDFNTNRDETRHFKSDDLEVVHTRRAKFVPEEPVTHVTGETRWYQTIKVPLVSDDGSEVQLLGIATDITERKRAQDELQAQHRFLRQVIDLNTSFIFAKDRTGKFTLINRALADAYGTTPEDAIGKYDEDFNPNREETRHFKSDDLEVVRTRQVKFVPEEPVSHVSGETRWYQTIKVPLISDDGRDVQLLGVATDITERRMVEERLRQAFAQEQAARQAVEAASHMKDRFFANMSHELRTPLNAIIGFLREMLYSGKLDADNMHMAERSLANGSRLSMLINSVLDLSRLAAGSLELIPVRVNLSELAGVIIDDLRLLAKEKDLRLEYSVDQALPTFVCHDEERLTQIITNLLTNAIKFTHEGLVKLELSLGASQSLSISVSDTGIGIPADMRNAVFESFVQVQSSPHGTGVGLGLSIVRQLVDLIGGRIRIDGAQDAGTIVIVELPLHLSQRPPPHARANRL